MSDVMISVPFLVMSTKLGPWGQVEKHVLTPFGDLDITMCAVSVQETGGLALDVQVGDGIECWMTGGSAMPSFQTTLVEFVGGMVREMLRECLIDVSELHIQLPGMEGATAKVS